MASITWSSSTFSGFSWSAMGQSLSSSGQLHQAALADFHGLPDFLLVARTGLPQFIDQDS